MIDRRGYPIRIGFAEHELIWISAALTLDRAERTEAFQDIADLTGRSLHSVQTKAYSIQKWRLEASRTRRSVVPARSMPCPQRAPLAPSQLKAITTAQRMGAR